LIEIENENGDETDLDLDRETETESQNESVTGKNGMKENVNVTFGLWWELTELVLVFVLLESALSELQVVLIWAVEREVQVLVITHSLFEKTQMYLSL
jgi:hypothetical protein